jgi:sulfite reductase alpha subunit-like flavoprotein
VVAVCSTTGNGDSPDNADKFWRTIKKRSIAKDTFEGLPFCVLALGDTNFDKFCHMGKSIDKRMKELGGSRFLELHCADEATGLEEVVEDWNTKVVTSLMQLIADVSSSLGQLSLVPEAKDRHGPATEEENTPESALTCVQIVQQGIATLADVCTFLDMSSVSLSTLPDSSLLLKSRKCAEGCVEILQACQNVIISEDFELREDGEYSVAHPFKAEVVGAGLETKYDAHTLDAMQWGEAPTVIRAELSIAGSGIQYQPGDYVSVIAPNPPCFVKFIIERLRVWPKSRSSASSVFDDDDLRLSANAQIRRSGEILTLQELFQYR